MPIDAAVESKSAETSSATETQNPYSSGKLTKEISNAWNQGKDPAPSPKKPADSASADTSKETPSAPDGKSVAASETVKDKKQEFRPKKETAGAEARIDELTRNFRDAERKAAKLEDELRQLRESNTTQKDTTASSTAKTAQGDELKEPVEPQLNDFVGKPWEEYEKAVRQYNRDLIKHENQKAILADRQQRNQEELSRVVSAQIAEATKAYTDFDTVAKPAVSAIWGDGKPESGAHPAVKHLLGTLGDMPHVLYFLGKEGTVNDLVALSRKDPVRACYELGVKHALIAEELAKAGKGSDGTKGETKNPPAKTETKESQAQPTAEVGSRGTGPADPTADAVRHANGKLTKAVSDAWARKAARRFQSN